LVGITASTITSPGAIKRWPLIPEAKQEGRRSDDAHGVDESAAVIVPEADEMEDRSW
jgi:hypothetical protein